MLAHSSTPTAWGADLVLLAADAGQLAFPRLTTTIVEDSVGFSGKHGFGNPPRAWLAPFFRDPTPIFVWWYNRELVEHVAPDMPSL